MLVEYILNNFLRNKINKKEVSKSVINNSRVNKRYYLGDKYPGVYLTQRQAECVVYLMKGYSNFQVARALKLSPRTVESYVKTLKQKFNCISREKFIQEIGKTDFMGHIDTFFNHSD